MKETIESTSGLASGIGSLLDSIVKARPGISIASEARGVASATDTMLDTIETTRHRCERMGLSDETTDAICMIVVNEFSKGENLGACLSFSSTGSQDSIDIESVDHSWFLRWADGASEQFDDEMRRIWGMVLDGELENPGRYSKRTLSILSDMSRDEAESFRKVCSYTIMDKDNNPFVVLRNDGAGTVNNKSISYSEIISLESLGLIDTNAKSFIRFEPGESIIILLNGMTMRIASKSRGDLKISFQPAMTKYGVELAKLCESEMGTGRDIVEILSGILSEQNYDLVEVGEDGMK